MKSILKIIMTCLYCTFTTGIAWSVSEGQDVEDIYVVRSLRLSRVPVTKFCENENTGFENAKFEDRYNFQALNIRDSDGIILDANVRTVGALHACFGPTSDPMVTSFYAEGNLGAVSFIGKGDCRTAKKDFPETGMAIYRCYLEIQGLPENYIGGHLTTNTVTSRQSIGVVSDPPGYVQPSIATVRLWKKRPGLGN